MSRTRVLHVLPWVMSGGVEKRRTMLAQNLPERFEQRVVCLEMRDPLAGAIHGAGVPIETIGRRPSVLEPSVYRDLTRIIREFQPDIVHGAVFEGVTMATVAGNLMRVPHVVIEEIDFPITRSWRGHLLFRSLSRFAEVCVAVSGAVHRYLVDEAGVSARKVRTIFNGIDSPELVDPEEAIDERRALGIPEDAFVVGSVGRVFDDHKRFSDLIKAMAEPDMPSDAHLVIVGTGGDLEMLGELAKERGVDDRVHFTGYRGDIGRLLTMMDTFALVSNRESFGLVLVEAMYASLPIVTTGIGGMGDIVIEGETGIYVGLGDTRAIATAIRQLRDDPELRARLGAAGRERADRFSTERYVADVAALYDELMAGSER